MNAIYDAEFNFIPEAAVANIFSDYDSQVVGFDGELY